MILGIGVDIVGIDRVRGVLGRHGHRFTERVLTAEEQAYCSRHADPAPSLASRFAAKEAALKALGTGLAAGINWRDVEVVRAPSGAPGLRLHRRAGEIAAQLGVQRQHLTLTHDAGVAVAVVVLES